MAFEEERLKAEAFNQKEELDFEEMSRLVSEISNTRCDAATGRLLKYMRELAGENVRAKIPQLEPVALARTLICMSVNSAGIDQGLKDAQYVFEDTFNELAPRIRKMPELRN